VSGRVARHQAEKFADRDQAIAANRGAGYAQGYQQTSQQPAYAEPAPAPAAGPDRMEQLKQLGELHASGVLSDAEFEAEKARILNS
jgi:hypothetical protein